MFSQASVILFTWGCIPACTRADTPGQMLSDNPPPPGRHWQTPPPGQTPPRQTPLPRRPLQRTVRILLECILVCSSLHIQKASYIKNEGFSPSPPRSRCFREKLPLVAPGPCHSYEKNRTLTEMYLMGRQQGIRVYVYCRRPTSRTGLNCKWPMFVQSICDDRKCT